jgi:hypothetical protein
MNDEDLRDLFAGLAMMGLLASARGIPIEVCTEGAYKFADAMIEAKYAEPEPVSEEGITAIKPKRKPRSTT